MSSSTNKAQEFADLSLQRIEDFDLLPTPENYELWFVYFSKSDPDLVNMVDSILKDVEKLSEMQCYGIYNEFLSGAREEKTVEDAGNQIQRTIDDVNVAVTAAKSSALKYSQNLKEKKKEAESNQVDDVGAFLGSVLKETDKMIGHNDLLEEMLEDSARAMEDMRRDLEAARKEALTDPLTGLSNRKAFDQEIGRLIEKSEGDPSYSFSMILMDIDHFKAFNDNFGHQIGDQVLKLVARTLREGVKGRDVVVRYGGEEFAVLLPETNLHGGRKIAEILRQEVEKKEVINRATGKQLAKITMSAGVSQYLSGEDSDTLVERVDTALYRAKDAGRNQVVTLATKPA